MGFFWVCGRACGLGAALLCWFHFFPSVCALVRGWVRAGGVGAASLSWPCPFPSVYRDRFSSKGGLCPGASFRLCAGTCELAVLVSVLVRVRAGIRAVLVPSNFAHSCWQRKSPPSWGAVLEQEGLGQEPGMCPGVVLASWPEPQAVFSLLPPHCDCKSVRVLFRSTVLASYSPLVSPTVFKPDKGSYLPGVRLQGWGA